MEKSTMSVILFVLHLLVLHLQYSEVHSLANTSAHDFSYLKFVYNATDTSLEGSYDYIVVGGGTSGCPLAATLSEKYKVLLLERGTIATEYPNTLTADGFAYNLQQQDDGKTPVERFVSEDGIDNVRGRILGGTTIINAGVYARANISFYSQSGVDWDMDLVNKTYEWVEDTIVVKPNNQSWQSVIGEGFLEAGILPDNGFSLDHEAGTRLTGSTFDNNGTRHAADELLNKGDPNNLLVAVRASVEKILFSSNTSNLSAIGVIYTDSDGNSHQAFVRGNGEVIVSAGTIGTPQLLLLSGVGPESYLSSLNITVVQPNPYVGQFVYDNPHLANCVSGMKKLGDLLRTKALEPYKARDVLGIDGFNYLGVPLPENQTDDASFETFCLDNVASYWHYHGGSLVGKVLDDSFRVMGIKALRVVDASTFPYEPNSHPQGFYMMLGRYVGLQILQERSIRLEAIHNIQDSK
ncbi:hypothetical protein CerSpe_009260 [Prunus speciosa]